MEPQSKQTIHWSLCTEQIRDCLTSTDVRLPAPSLDPDWGRDGINLPCQEVVGGTLGTHVPSSLVDHFSKALKGVLQDRLTFQKRDVRIL